MKAIPHGLMAFAFLLFGVAQIVTGAAGIDHYLGGFWTILIVSLAIFLRFPLPITIGAFFGATEVWGWHWLLALLFAAPGLALVVPSVLAGVLDWIRTRWSRDPSPGGVTAKSAPAAPVLQPPPDVDHSDVGTGGVRVERRGSGWVVGAVAGFVVGLFVGVLVPRDNRSATAGYDTERSAGGPVAERPTDGSPDPAAESPEDLDALALDADQEMERALSSMDRVELGQLIRRFMLDVGEEPSWAMLSAPGDPVRWLTDGVEPTEDRSGTMRNGIARLSVDGKIMTTLRRTAQELPWEVTLAGDDSPKFGPHHVTIGPRNDCFGSLGSGCDFEIEQTVQSANLELERLCTQVPYGNGFEVYEVKAPDKQDAILVYSASTGSGGTSNAIALYWSPSAIDPEVQQCLGVNAEAESQAGNGG